MLNRLYIVLGVLAILALAAAFIVPSFIPWGAYRDRMAAIAGEVLGAPVRIDGEVKFTLLPQPRLQFSEVSAGPADAPNLTVAGVVAEFSLIDFLRDRYVVNRLELDGPQVVVDVHQDGTVQTGLALPRQVSKSNISIANALIRNGSVQVKDARSETTYVADHVSGELRLEALRGPFSFQGSAALDGMRHALRITAGKLDDAGSGQLSASLRPEDGHYALNIDGRLTTGLAPAFSGNMTYRQPPGKPAQSELQDVGQGDLVMTSKVEATPSKVLLSDYVVIPDENRAATRLQGAAEIALGKRTAFNAVISGGLLALPPRDATAEPAIQPYELVRLLGELPIPPAPSLEGTIGLDLAELNLRAFSLRNVRVDAKAEGGGWSVRQFTGQLPGETTVKLSGRAMEVAGHPEFSGDIAITTKHLDALSTLWRKPADGNPLFGMSGGIAAKVDLVADTLSLSQGKLTLDGQTRSFGAQIGLGNSRDIHLNADLGQLDPARSAALFALVPDLTQDIAFPITFPKGEFSLVADSMTIAGLDGRALVANGSWEGGVLVFDKVSAGDLGGAAFDVALTAFGSFAKPELSGSGTIRLASAGAPALAALYDTVKTPPAVRDFLAASMPVDVAVKLAAPSGQGAQSLSLSGRLGPSEIDADAQLQAGFLRATSSPLKLRLDLRSADAAAASAQLGFGSDSLFPEDRPLHLVGIIEGNPGNSFETTVRVEGGEDFLGFAGNIVVTDPEAFTGKGTLKASLSDLSPLVERVGAGGLTLPALSGSATLEFKGLKSVRLADIAGTSGGETFTGNLNISGIAGTPTVSGEIAAGNMDLAGLVGALAGPAALLNTGSGPWPDGPFATGTVTRGTVGRVKVTAPLVNLDATHALNAVAFDLEWDATAARLRGLTGSLAGGKLALELSLCCAGPLSDKQATGRFSLTDVDLDRIVTPAVADALGGRIDAAGHFNGTGGSIAGILGALTGEGTYTVNGLRIERLDPGAVRAAVAGLGNVIDSKPDELAAMIADKLDDAPFSVPALSGSFTIAGGVVRSPNVTAEGEGGALFGSGQIRLADLGIGGSYILSATGVEPAALVDETAAKATANLSGTLFEPQRSFDVSALVDAIMVKAYEAEVARLEKLRAEDEARRKAEADRQAMLAAEEQARQAAEAKRLADEAAAKKAAEEKAAADKAAAEKAAADKAAADEAAAAKMEADTAAARRAAEEVLAPDMNPPLDLGLGPAWN